MEIKELFLHKSFTKRSSRSFRNGIHSWLRRADARGGAEGADNIIMLD